MGNKLLVALAQNANFLVTVAGFSVLYVGVWSLSPPVANIVAGVLLMGAGVWPYLRPRKR